MLLQWIVYVVLYQRSKYKQGCKTEMDISENIERKMEMDGISDGISDEETEKLPEIQVGFIDI